MVEYQFGYIWRYLMWNFVGRQNDIQGKYDYLDGNWLSGITFLDELHLGSKTISHRMYLIIKDAMCISFYLLF
jgi:hypothetical protein